MIAAGSAVSRKPFGRMTIFGDSLASDQGATITDWGVSHKLGELLNAAPMRNQAISGAILACAQIGNTGDGGATFVLNKLPRQELTGPATLLTNAPVAGSSVNLTVTAGTGANYSVGDVISIGGTTPDQSTITAIATDTITVGTLAHTHAIGDPVVRGAGNYLPLEQIAMVVYGINDLLNLGPDANGPTNATLQPFAWALRAAIARIRCSVVYEDNYAGIVYGANWTPVTGNTNKYSGGNAHTTTTSGSTITILVPGDTPATNLVFGFLAETGGGGALWTIAASGGQFVTFTHDNRNSNFFKYNLARGGASDVATPTAVRVAVPAANGTPYKITITATTVSGTATFDWFGIEAAPTQCFVMVTKENRPSTINQPGVAYPSRTATTLSAGSYPAGTTAWTAGSTTGWKIGDTVKIGTGATSDSLTVLTIPTGTTFTTSHASINAHAAGDAVQAGFSDVDVTGISANYSTGAADGGAVNLAGLSLNGRIQAIVNEFDSFVGPFDKDVVLQRKANWFINDGLHYNNQGHTELAIAMYTWLNNQAAITLRLLASANVPNQRDWLTVGANVPPNTIAFKSSYGNIGTAGFYTAQFRKDITTGLVMIAGAVTGGAGYNDIILTVPVGFRPASIVPIVGESDAGPGIVLLRLDGNGNLYPLQGYSQNFMNFYGIYLAEQ